jgi:DNA mismatch repair ATPase MutS
LQKLLTVYEQELDSATLRKFANDDGSEFKNANHPYINDLDVFGARSLFHLLNRCQTFNGKTYFAEQLKSPPKDISIIYKRHAAIRELQDKKKFIFNILASLPSKKKQVASPNADIHWWLQQPALLDISKAMQIFIKIMPFFNLAFLLLALCCQSVFFVILLIFATTQYIVLQHYSRASHTIKEQLNGIINDAAKINLYAKSIRRETFQSPWLQHIQQQVAQYNNATCRLYKMLSAFDMSDGFVGEIWNFLFLQKLKTSVKLEKWKKENQNTLPQLIECICEWETIISLSVFYINHPTFVFPEFLEQNSSAMIDATGLGHPLVAEEKRVVNGITIDKNNVFIITGANMAGKSTFLRTVGINLLLARVGAPVCATSFRCIPLSLFTSMRTADDLDNGISYFYAEALRIKEMLNFVKSGEDILIIVDELFRGTNSDDRLKSSLSFIRQLMHNQTLSALVATHDLGITVLEKEYPQKIKNYCFECFNNEDQIVFDYKLKAGITQSCNAYLLLQKMNIIP